MKKKRTLVELGMDADLRKPRLHKVYLNGVNACGLSTYLVGNGVPELD